MVVLAETFMLVDNADERMRRWFLETLEELVNDLKAWEILVQVFPTMPPPDWRHWRPSVPPPGWEWA